MARLTDDDFAVLRAQAAADAVRPLGSVRQAEGAQRDEATDAWLGAGANLAEKAVAALAAGDSDRAARLIGRIVGLPLVEDGLRSGLMAVHLVLLGEVLDADDEPDPAAVAQVAERLPGLDPVVARELRRLLVDLPGVPALPADDRADLPFAGVAEADLPAAVEGLLRVVLALRTGR